MMELPTSDYYIIETPSLSVVMLNPQSSICNHVVQGIQVIRPCNSLRERSLHLLFQGQSSTVRVEASHTSTLLVLYSKVN